MAHSWDSKDSGLMYWTVSWCFHGNNSSMAYFTENQCWLGIATLEIQYPHPLSQRQMIWQHTKTALINYCLRHFPQGWATTCSTGPKDTRSSGSGEQSPFERWECYWWVPGQPLLINKTWDIGITIFRQLLLCRILRWCWHKHVYRLLCNASFHPRIVNGTRKYHLI